MQNSVKIITIIFFGMILTISLVSADFGYNKVQEPSVETIFGYNKIQEILGATASYSYTGNLTNFTSLEDTPNSYAGAGSKCVKVNAGATALEFIACAGGGDVLNNTSGWILNFTALFSKDWTNVTVTESQISDLSHTVDTSAFVNCSTDEVFLGNGSCISSSTFGGGNESWNETYADTLYSDIQWNYNQTTATFDLYNSTWDNSFMNIWNYNQSTAVYNMHDTRWYQILWDAAFNATGDTRWAAGSSYAPSQINLTASTHNGNITNNTAVGYEAGDQICDIEFTDSHFCTEFEVALYQGDDINGEDAWIIAGSPKYIPATVPVNDCQGWTYSGTVTALGNYWHFNTNGKGEGRAINCGTSLKLACCSY